MSFDTSLGPHPPGPGAGHDAARLPSTPPPMRLTRRGRVVLVALFALVLLVAFGLGRATTADAGGSPPPARRTVVVRPGDTLWQIARRAAPGADPRATVRRIALLNDLEGPVRPGQRLLLP